MNIVKSEAVGCNTCDFIKQFGKMTSWRGVDVRRYLLLNYFVVSSRIMLFLRYSKYDADDIYEFYAAVLTLQQ